MVPTIAAVVATSHTRDESRNKPVEFIYRVVQEDMVPVAESGEGELQSFVIPLWSLLSTFLTISCAQQTVGKRDILRDSARQNEGGTELSERGGECGAKDGLHPLLDRVIGLLFTTVRVSTGTLRIVVTAEPEEGRWVREKRTPRELMA